MRDRDRRRFAWLDLNEAGQSTKEIAARYAVPQRTVQHEIRLARDEVLGWVEECRLLPAPKLVPIFPLGGFSPNSRCGHRHKPIKRGSVLYCAVCHRSGMDHLPALQRFPRYDGTPDQSGRVARVPRKGKSAQAGRRGPGRLAA